MNRFSYKNIPDETKREWTAEFFEQDYQSKISLLAWYWSKHIDKAIRETVSELLDTEDWEMKDVIPHLHAIYLRNGEIHIKWDDVCILKFEPPIPTSIKPEHCHD